MKTVRFMILGVVILCMAGVASAAVVLDETFTNLDAWTSLATAGSGGTVSVGVSGGNLDISMSNNPAGRLQGVQSNAQYALPAGPSGMLIIDSYGINSAGDGSHSNPNLTVSAFSSTGFFAPWGGNYVNLKGWDAYWGDWAQSSVLGYADLAGANISSEYHSIITIDATNMKWYLATDFFENLVSPTALYTASTSGVFTSGELTAGLYIDILAARYTSWFSGTCSEQTNGVRVTSIPEPVTLVLLGIGGVTLLLRKKK